MNEKSDYDYHPEKTDAKSVDLAEQVEEDEFVHETHEFTW